MSITTTTAPTPVPTCTHPKPGKNGYLPPEACDAILYYEPSHAAATLFVVVFGLTVIAHIVQARYAWVLIMGATWECLAFVFRTLLTFNQNSPGYDTGYVLLFLLSPLWINAFIYMTLGRMIYYYIPTQRLGGITASRYGLIFIWLDIVAFLVQAAGASIASNQDASTKTTMLGLHIYMGGIGLQQFFMVIFAGMIIYFHRHMLEMERHALGNTDRLSGRWRWLFYTIYFALTMITIRIIFRLCEYGRGFEADNPVLTSEAYEYVLDATPMFCAILALNLVHPGTILKGPEAEFPRLSRKQKKQLKREKKEMKKQRKLKGTQADTFESLSLQEEANANHSTNYSTTY